MFRVNFYLASLEYAYDDENVRSSMMYFKKVLAKEIPLRTFF